MYDYPEGKIIDHESMQAPKTYARVTGATEFNVACLCTPDHLTITPRIIKNCQFSRG